MNGRVAYQAAAALGMLLLAAGGCASGPSNLADHGIVYYCDGAGGGGITNWGPGVKKGLKDAGYNGEFKEFRWETQLGVVADQVESVKAKRAQAAKLAREITDYQSKYPDKPVNLIGLSAGTAIALFALEALPDRNDVDTVVLLSSSVSSDYPLTAALRHVEGNVYVTTSPNDQVLSVLAPGFGTADRQYVGQQIAGLHGFHMPPGAGAETRRAYSKVVLLAWDPTMERYGDYGGHTQTTNPAFVQHVVAPLVIGEGPRQVRLHAQGTGNTYRTVSD